MILKHVVKAQILATVSVSDLKSNTNCFPFLQICISFQDLKTQCFISNIKVIFQKRPKSRSLVVKTLADSETCVRG